MKSLKTNQNWKINCAKGAQWSSNLWIISPLKLVSTSFARKKLQYNSSPVSLQPFCILFSCDLFLSWSIPPHEITFCASVLYEIVCWRLNKNWKTNCTKRVAQIFEQHHHWNNVYELCPEKHYHTIVIYFFATFLFLSSCGLFLAWSIPPLKNQDLLRVGSLRNRLLKSLRNIEKSIAQRE